MTVIIVHNAYTAMTVIIVPAVVRDGLRFHFLFGVPGCMELVVIKSCVGGIAWGL